MAPIHTPFSNHLLASQLVSREQLERVLGAGSEPPDDRELAERLVRKGLLTRWQAGLIREGKTQGFFLAQYKLLEPLGAGGMGQVYGAVDRESGQQVAIKVLPRKAATRGAVLRFRREGQAALVVQHPHIIRTFCLGQQGETYFLVMELVRGTDLAKHISRHGKLSVGETARIGYEVALALEHARGHGIIHRDVKPSNVLLDEKGRVKLADLGLAKFFGGDDEGPTTLTQSGAVLGTIDYMAPEQAEDAKRADTRSDIYSLGCTLYKCLTGRAPFEDGTHVQKLLAHRQQEPDPITLWNPDVPHDFAKLINSKMLAKSRADRFQTPAEVAAALAPWARAAGDGSNLTPLPDPDEQPPLEGDSTGHSLPDGLDPNCDSVTVTCTVCGTRIGATQAQFGKKVQCPDCETLVPVPWPKKTPSTPAPKAAEISTYDVLPMESRIHTAAPSDQPQDHLQPPPPVSKEWAATERPNLLIILGSAILGALILLIVLALLGLLRLPWLASK